MSFLTDLEAEANHIFVVLEDDAKALGALLWGKVKAAGLAGEQVLVAAIPGAVKAVKDYASQEIRSIEADPAFRLAAGDWKLGVACSRVLDLVVGDFPALEKVGGAALSGLIKSAVQAGWLAITTGE